MTTTEKETVRLNRFVVVGPNYWGKGEDLQQAFWNWYREARPRKGVVLQVRQVDESAYMDEIGNLHYKRIKELPYIELTAEMILAYEDAKDSIDQLLLDSELEADFDELRADVQAELDAMDKGADNDNGD